MQQKHILKVTLRGIWSSTDFTPQQIPKLTHQGEAPDWGWSLIFTIALLYSQCFDTVGWVSRRASGL